jgi:hypothetical protein
MYRGKTLIFDIQYIREIQFIHHFIFELCCHPHKKTSNRCVLISGVCKMKISLLICLFIYIIYILDQKSVQDRLNKTILFQFQSTCKFTNITTKPPLISDRRKKTIPSTGVCWHFIEFMSGFVSPDKI